MDNVATLNRAVVEAFFGDEEWPQLERWALDILKDAAGKIVVPETYSMRQAMDNLWVRHQCEKTWVGKQNAYYLDEDAV